MLKVKTSIKQSTIPGAGYGLFAEEFIPKGTLIWELDINFDRIISKKDYEEMNEIYKEFILTYGYTTEDYPFIILCGDNARFVNHNVPGNMKEGEGKFGFMEKSIASVDIYPGEEIFEDYSIFDDKSLGNKNDIYY